MFCLFTLYAFFIIKTDKNEWLNLVVFLIVRKANYILLITCNLTHLLMA